MSNYGRRKRAGPRPVQQFLQIGQAERPSLEEVYRRDLVGSIIFGLDTGDEKSPDMFYEVDKIAVMDGECWALCTVIGGRGNSHFTQIKVSTLMEAFSAKSRRYQLVRSPRERHFSFPEARFPKVR